MPVGYSIGCGVSLPPLPLSEDGLLCNWMWSPPDEVGTQELPPSEKAPALWEELDKLSSLISSLIYLSYLSFSISGIKPDRLF